MEEVEAINANPRWAMPRRGWVKINVHGRFFDRPLPNGNISKIGVVVCNSRGRILRILSGSLDIQNFQMDVTLCDPEANALAAYLAGAHNFKLSVEDGGNDQAPQVEDEVQEDNEVNVDGVAVEIAEAME
ncbi:hypothetical protein ACET3Z_000358 [Daucus carota]